MLSAHLTCASSCSSQCCPSPAVPVPCPPSPLSTGASCTSSKLPRICSLRGARRGQQISLCLSQGSQHTMLSIPQQSARAAGWLRGAEAVQGSQPGWECSRDAGGEFGPHVYPQCSVPSTLHTARASPPSVHSPGTGNGTAGRGWSSARFVWLHEQLGLTVAAGTPPQPLAGEAAGCKGTGRRLKFTSVPFFFP